MDGNETKNTLTCIKSNSQYLTNMVHYSQLSSHQEQYKMNIQQQQLCPLSCIQLIIQLTYLLYTCSVLKTDIFVGITPLFSRRYNTHGLFVCKMIYHLEGQSQKFQQIIKQKINNNTDKYKQITSINHQDSLSPQEQKDNYSINIVKMKHKDFNQNILDILIHLLQKTKHKMNGKTSQCQHYIKIMQVFHQQIRQYLVPILQLNNDKNKENEKQIKIIKHLQSTKLFIKHSSLLKMFHSSLLYKVKNDQKLIQNIKKLKQSTKEEMMLHFYRIQIFQGIYRRFDNFLQMLINAEIFYMEKSSTKDTRNLNNGYIVGSIINKSDETTSSKKYEIYEAKFYSLDLSYKNCQNFIKKDKDKNEHYYIHGKDSNVVELSKDQKEKRSHTPLPHNNIGQLSQSQLAALQSQSYSYTNQYVASQNSVKANKNRNYPNTNEREPLQKTTYCLQYCPTNYKLTLHLISPIQITTQQTDIVSIHLSNLNFNTMHITVQMYETVISTLKKIYTRKYVAFKIQALVQKTQQPFTKFMNMYENLTICSKVFLDLMLKLPTYDKLQALTQYGNKLEHYQKIFVDRAKNYYSSL